MSNNDTLLNDLALLDLSNEEARVYIELLGKPSTHLKISRATGIHRMKVYRIVERLEKRSFVRRRVDDRGTFIVADRPVAFDMEQSMHEEKLRHRRTVIDQVMPQLVELYNDDGNSFAIHTYTGVDGMKQMAWHELRTEGELLAFGNSTFEEMVDDPIWSEKLREMIIQRGYKTREIFNDPSKQPDFTVKEHYMNRYEVRRVPEDALPVATPMIMYNDTVEIYQFTDGKHVGIEIINAEFAKTMRSIFELYWRLGEEVT